MKTKCVTIGIGGDAENLRYSNGKCTIRVLVLQGDSDSVQIAEKRRRDILRREAERLYTIYMECSVKELNELFDVYGVSCLSDLIKTRILQKMYILLSYQSAKTVLEISKINFGSSLEMSVMPGLQDDGKERENVRL